MNQLPKRWLVLITMVATLAGSRFAFADSQNTDVTPQKIVYLTEDYPPSNYMENGELKGIAVEVLKAMWAKMNVPAQKIEVINWARGYKQTETVPNTMLFAMTRTPERENKFQWVGPIYRGSYVLYSRSDKRIPLKTAGQAASYKVGVLREDLGHKLMLEAGIADGQLEKVAQVQQLVKMLNAGRIDLMCVYADTLTQYARQQGLDPATFVLELTLKENTMYYALNKATSPAVVGQFQRALSTIDRERRQIVKAYGGAP
jgi:polar amino acid transport system substrate-binding protein